MMLPPNCKTNMSYKPRSGTFRKVKYPINIYKEDEIPRRDFEEMMEMASRIKTEDPCQEICLDVGDEAERKLNIAMRKTMKSDPVGPSLCVKSESTCVRSSSDLPQSEFSLNPVNLYSSAYPDDNSLPPFPVTSCADSNCSSDSEGSQCESDYDMDSEDEEWLKKNQELNITPNRFEYIFSKLNKRNTHVPEKAVGALPVTVHSDFNHLFPYWKEKRLLNKNSSSFKRDFQQTDGKLALGYVSTNPLVTFAHKVQKPLVQQSPPPSKILQKLGRQEKAKLCFKRMVELREKLECLRSYALKLERKGLNDRDKIQNKLSNLTRM